MRKKDYKAVLNAQKFLIRVYKAEVQFLNNNDIIRDERKRGKLEEIWDIINGLIDVLADNDPEPETGNPISHGTYTSSSGGSRASL